MINGWRFEPMPERRSGMKVTPSLAARRDLAQLEKRFQSAQESYVELGNSCESHTVRWQWANGPVYELDPLFFLDPDIRAGHISPLPPQDPAGWMAYGFDDDGRLLAARQYTELTNQYYQEFYVWLTNRTVGYRFHHSASRTVLSCSQLVTDSSGPSYFQRWGSRGWASYTYESRDRKVSSFLAVAKEPDEPQIRFSGQVTYKENGLVELWIKESGQRKAELSFRGRPPIDNPFVR
jgi:hypothetical protein